MAHLLSVDSVSLRFGTRSLFDQVTLGIDDGDRIGVVGPNGAGKSTLLRLLAGQQPPDAGRVTRLGGQIVGSLAQRDHARPGERVLDAVHGEAEPHEWATDPRVRAVHAGLLADLELDQPLATLSGGQRRRVALAALLVSDPDLLLLDEPTNHLDVEGVDWLARHLVARYGARAGSKPRGAVVVVTHDRWFLDAIGTRMWEVVGTGPVAEYEGGYAAYVLARAERARQASVAATKRDNLLRKELAWLRRGAPARTSKPKFRLDAAAMLINDEPPPRDSVELTRLATRRLGKDVLDLEAVSLAFPSESGGPPRRILEQVTWRLGPGDRFGIVGVNGAGKTTLLSVLAGRLAPNAGRVKRGKTVAVAELTQGTELLDDVSDRTAVQVIEGDRRVVRMAQDTPGFLARTHIGSATTGELSAGQLTERLGFTRERAHTPVRDLSGGERRRLQLLRLLVAEPNVLLLDEPTNDLDTDTLAAVEDLLDSWAGTLVVVSHDRYLLERVCDRQWAMYGDGQLVDLPGGVEQYLQVRRAAEAPAPEPRADTAPASNPSTQAGMRQAKKELARLERRLDRLAQEQAALHARIAADPTNHVAVAEADQRLQELAQEREDLETGWLLAAESLAE